MYIESIEIYGFKTFVNNTKFILSRGITCIVGPNGSGKSNIVDAIRFLFGENRLSLLRASESSDLIFAGSTSKEPMNIASVKIVINNEDKTLPIKTPRVIIERRIVRGKETRYIVNGNDSSLQNVQEIFKSSNIFGLTHAIVGQGRIEEILLSKPEEKKAIIDRVAGITDLRKRKEEAKKKLEETEDNLAKASVVLTSIKTEYDRVLREAKKVHIYYALISDLKVLEEKLYSFRLLKLREELSKLKIGLEEKKKEESDVQKHLLEIKGQYEEVNSRLQEAQKKLELLTEKREELNIKKNKVSSNIDSTKNLIELKESELTELNLRKERLLKTKSYLISDVEKNNLDLEKLKDDLLKLENDENVLKSQYTMKKNELSVVEEEYNKFSEQLKQRESERITIEKKISAFEKEVEIGNRKLQEISRKLEPLKTLERVNIDEIKEKLQQLDIEIEEKKKALQEKEKEIAVLEFRIKSLKSLLESAKVATFSDGSLGKTLHISKNLFGLKDYLEGVIVNSIDEIKNKDGKRFFVEAFAEGPQPEVDGLTPISKILGVENKFLTGIYYADTLEEAIKKFNDYKGITHIREIVTGDGFIVLSPFEVEKSSGINIEEERQYNALLSKLSGLKENLKVEKENLNVLENRKVLLLSELEKAKEIERLLMERARLTEEFENIKKDVEKFENILSGLKEERTRKLLDRITFDTTKLTSIRSEVEKLREEISKLMLRKKELELKIESINKNTDELKRRISSIDREVEELEVKREKLSKELEGFEDELNNLITLLNELELDLVSATHEIDGVKSEVSSVKENEANLRIRLEELNDQKESIHAAIEKIELNIARVEVSISSLLSEMEEKELEERHVDSDLKEESLKSEIQKLRKEIEELQPLDFTSIDKENELKANYEEKKTVFDDISSSKRELEKYIKELETTIKNKFDKTFDALNTHFERIFVEIFGEGEAKIEKVLDEFSEVKGVEISVRLPFKKKQPLSVFSGGEKSLVALAFLFAIFEVNPTPFYVLDEVDAALDDENVYKFGKLLESMKEKSQLIVITHNKQTMEKADILYGITMEEAGISKVVSLKFA